MHTSATLPRWGQLLAGGAVLAIAVTAGAVSLTLNVLGHIDNLPSAIAYGLADIGKIAIPIVAAAIGWTWQTRATLAVCALASMASVSIYLYDTHGQALFAHDAQAATYAGAQADIARARAELAAIGETGDAAALAAAAKLATDRAKAEAANGGCRSKCLAAQGEAAVLTERSGKAKRRAELETKLDAAKTEAGAAGAVQASGAGRQWLTAGMAALGLLLLETLVYLSIPGAALMAAALRAKPVRRRSKGGPGRGKPVQTRGNVVPLRGPADIAKLAAAGHKQREIAEMTGLSKSTVHRRLAALRTASGTAQAACR